MEIDIDTPMPKDAITSLPENFQLRNLVDIQTLKEYIANEYAKGLCLYRGHESKEYKIESTITRFAKKIKNNCSLNNILNIEKQAYNLFNKDVFKTEWLKYKIQNTNEDFFKMSIGRHLGLPCRLIDVTASLDTAIWFAVMNPQFYDQDGEIILFILDKNIHHPIINQSPFDVIKVSYAQEPFLCDSLNNLPLGEQRRSNQYGRFILVDNNSLLDEEQVIKKSIHKIERFSIPSDAKITLAKELYRDVYSGFAFRYDIERIKQTIAREIIKQILS